MTMPDAIMLAAIALPLIGAAPGPSTPVPSTPDLGKAQGQCRPGAGDPILLADVVGLKDRTGKLKLEVYPANDQDFLADDNVLINSGKTFARVEQAVPSTGTPRLCIRLPRAGTYAVSLLHDRDADRKFNWRIDGIGFAGNPRLGWNKPKATKASVAAGNGATVVEIVLNYRHGLGVAPLPSGAAR